jgi:ubiquinone/menaquinone biosynthesis C-methylase UbiE
MEILSVSVDRQYFGRLMLRHSMTAIDKRGGKYTVKADVTALPLGNDKFDVVIQSHCIEHVPDDRKATSEIARVMKPHGTYVSCVPIVDEHVDYAKTVPPNYHQRDYSVISYKKLLTGFFDPVEVCDLSPVPDLGTYIFVAFKGGKG